MDKISFTNFYKSTIPDKYWKIKDTQVVNFTTGNYWSLKKYIVFYINFYVNRGEINKDTLINTHNNFLKFINSIKNKSLHNEANKFFLNNLNPEKIIPFSEFNDMGTEHDQIARATYSQRLMGTGGQSGIMEYIKNLLNQNKTLSQIIAHIEKKKDWYISNNVKHEKNKIYIFESGNLKKINQIVNKKGEKIPTKNTLDDFHASFTRNTRQVYSKLGFLPPNSDGISYNQISKLIFNAENEIELNAICVHQKILQRIGNPYTDPLINYNVKTNRLKLKKFAKNEDSFNDFKVNPFISLMDLLKYIIDDEELDNYISRDEYQYIVTRVAPFNVNTCIALIKDFRRNPHSNLENREKQRHITNKEVSDGFQKALTFMLYGHICKNNRKNDLRNLNNNAFIEIKNKGIYQIINVNTFKEYYEQILNIKIYLDKKYKSLYNEISNDYEAKLANEFTQSSPELDNNFRQKIFNKYQFNNFENIGDYLQSWSNYIQTIDVDLFNKILKLNKIVYPFDYLQKLSTTTKVIKKHKNITTKVNKRHKNIYQIFSNNVLEKLAERSGYLLDNDSTLVNDRTEFNKIRNCMKHGRLNGIYHRKKFDKQSADYCDSCGTNKTKLECHHIIPHRIGGPDRDLNLVFLCKKCHNSFTFLTKAKNIDTRNDRIKIIQSLRLKAHITFNNFVTLINENHIKTIHLDYLFNDGYITFSERLELRKKLFEKQKATDKKIIESNRFNSKINKRWGRLMREVFVFRTEKNYVSGQYNLDYSIYKCDGGCGTSIQEKCECHHIIPKKGSKTKSFTSQYGEEPLNGPESEFNYLYLCHKCHLEFTNHTEKRKDIVYNIRKRNLVNYDTILSLIISSDIEEKQINFLYDENFINKKDYDLLIEDLIIKKRYQS